MALWLIDGELVSVGCDGVFDVVVFLKVGVLVVEFGFFGGGHHGLDEWVLIDSLARYWCALVDFVCAVFECFAVDIMIDFWVVDGGLV